ncbi:EAL domain-containing protein [Diaphorobacter ruginosibacter]|uniref:bifunctional diguanylate cyclase/phosphodiesterase n=1 Tax=Diaphorobacter ruginosibacter TaxID=1715720 RepID=UPI0033416822
MPESSSARLRTWFWIPALLVAVLGLLASSAIWRYQRAQAAATERARFEQQTELYVHLLQRRLQTYADVLSWLQGVLQLNPQWTPKDFKRFASGMDLPSHHPGLLGVTFTRLATSGDPAPGLENADALARAGDARAIVMSEPFEMRQLAAGPIGVAMHLPLFQGDARAAGGRRISGTLDAAIGISALIDSLREEGQGSSLLLGMTDMGEADASGALLAAAAPGLLYKSVANDGGVLLHKEIPVGGRLWRLDFGLSAPLLSPAEKNLPLIRALGGILIMTLLAAITLLLGLRRAQAVHHEQDTARALELDGERVRTLLSQAAVGVLQIDGQTGRIEHANKKFSDISGYSLGELQRMRFRDLAHPDDQEREGTLVRRMAAGEIQETRLEKRCLRKDGRIAWVDLTVAPMPGTARRTVAVVMDITERKEMLEALRTSEERLRGILNHLPIGIALLKNGVFDFSNERYTRACGYGTREIHDMDGWWNTLVVDPQERGFYARRWQDACNEARGSGGYIRPHECIITHKSGHSRSIEMAGVILGDDCLVTLVDISQRKAVEERARYFAYYDPLTQLPNRRLLLDRLQQALAMSARSHTYGAVLMLDLDNFKSLNETQGHDMGDRLLGVVAQRLRASVHADDTVARHGGDEFVVVLRSLGENEQAAAAGAEEMAQKILGLMRDPFEIDGEMHHTTLSIGITLFHGQRESADELLKRGDLALYRAKAEGRNMLRFFDPQMQAIVEARVALESDMRAGMALEQFELAYQPQMSHGRIVGAEVLMRWLHPEKGSISPVTFIPLAEDSGLIHRLGEWVLRTACERLAAWAQDPLLGELSLAVNVSAPQFHQAGFVPQVLTALASTGADPRKLRLELTESLLLEDIDDTVQKMERLKSYGVGFSLDDFGTGYSSLSYLKRLPLDELKIDQSFVRDVLTDPNDAAIARTIVALGTSLGLRVAAEGVESEAQRQFLERNRCHAWQGYLLSPPLPLEEFESLIKACSVRRTTA